MLKAQDSDILCQKIDTIINEFFAQEITIAGIGLFQTKVVYLQPVLNWYLHNISVKINNTFLQEQQKDNKYIPYNWIPHISIAKRLTDTEQLVTLGHLTTYGQLRLFDGKKSLSETVEELLRLLDKKGLAAVCKGNYVPGGLAMVRKQEIFACLNRYRSLKI